MCDKQEQNAGDNTAATAQPADEAAQAADDLARELLHGLGFCGHYLHFRNGGMSGRAPIICLIAKRGGQMSQQELGASFELKPGSLSEVLNKMETCGLIERKRNPEDRRQLTVRLTDAGFEQARLEQEGRTKFRAEAFTCLDDAEKGKIESVPDWKWKIAMFVGDHGPRALTRWFSRLLTASRKH